MSGFRRLLRYYDLISEPLIFYELFPGNPYTPLIDIVKEYHKCSIPNKQYGITFTTDVTSYTNSSGGNLYISQRSSLNEPITFQTIGNNGSFTFDRTKPYRFAIGDYNIVQYYKNGVESIYTGECSTMQYGALNTSGSSTACKTIKQVYYNDNFTTLGPFALAFSSYIYVPPSFTHNLRYIKNQVFRMIYTMKGSIIDFSNIYEINQGAFNNVGNKNSNGFDNVIFPTDHPCDVYDGAFWLTRFKDSVYLPNTLTLKPNNTFANQVSVKEYIIDTNIPSWCFRHDEIGNGSLTTIRFKKNCRSMSGQAFYYCRGIRHIYCEWEGNEVPAYSSSAWNSSSIGSSTLYIPAGNRSYYQNKGWISKVANVVEI